MDGTVWHDAPNVLLYVVVLYVTWPLTKPKDKL